MWYWVQTSQGCYEEDRISTYTPQAMKWAVWQVMSLSQGHSASSGESGLESSLIWYTLLHCFLMVH